jgi:pimeloyl-ACP methyl ester carboxylesterase
MTSIIFVGGFGASSHYSEPMCRELQRLTQIPVYNFHLQHGCTLQEECIFIENHLKKYEKNRYILIGFSTGCLIVMELLKYLEVHQVILCNPAEILTRLNYPLVESLLEKSEKTRNITTYSPIWEKESARFSKFSIFAWKLGWFLLDALWTFTRWTIGIKRMSQNYYHCVARHVNEPRADEFARLLFRKDLKDLRRTLTECLLKPSLHEKIRDWPGKVHIVQGLDDALYIPYGNLLFQHNKNVILHRTIGDHHMIYHYQKITAERIAAVIH